MPGVLGALTLYGLVLGHLSAAQLLCSSTLSPSSDICRAILCLHLGDPDFKAAPHEPFCSTTRLPWMQDKDCISHDMDEAILHARQSTGQAEDVGSDTLKPYLLSIQHPDNMGGKSTDTTSIKSLCWESLSLLKLVSARSSSR